MWNDYVKYIAINVVVLVCALCQPVMSFLVCELQLLAISFIQSSLHVHV